MKKQIFIILLLLNFSILQAQHWPVIIGDNISTANASLIEDYDKGYLLGDWNFNNSYSSKFYGWIVKTDINGNILWTKTFGNGIYQMYFSKVMRTSDNAILICGSTGKYDSQNFNDPLFMKLNACGETEWCTVIHDEQRSWDNYGTGIIDLADGSSIGMIKYYGTDALGYRISLIKLDPYGNPLWVKHLVQNDSSVFNEEGYDLILTSDSNYLVGGHCYSSGLRALFILSDKSGNNIWTLKWYDPNFIEDIDKITEKDTGIFYASGSAIKTGTSGFRPMLLKFNKYGNQLYLKLLIGDTVKNAGGGPMSVFNDTTLVFGYGYGVDPNPYIGFSGIETTDTLGNVINLRNLISMPRVPTNIITTYDKKIVVVGHYFIGNSWDVYLWKLNMNLEDDSIYTQPRVYDSLCPDHIVSDTVDIGCGMYVEIGEIPTKQEYDSPLKIFPNPSSNTLNINVKQKKNSFIKITDIFGRTVKIYNMPATRKLIINVTAWHKGIYMVSLYAGNKHIISKKLSIIH